MALTIDSSSILSMYYGASSTAASTSTSAFAAIDENEDGAIDEDELASGTSQSGSTSDAEALLESMDADGDESISEDEFSTYTGNLNQRLQAIQEARDTMSRMTLQIVQSIDGPAKSKTGVSVTKTSSTIVNLYADNLLSTGSQALSNLNIVA